MATKTIWTRNTIHNEPEKVSGTFPETDPKETDTVSEAPVERVRNRAEKIARFANIFAELPTDTTWAVETTARLKQEIETYAKSKGDAPAIESLSCRGEVLCRVVLDHKSIENAMASSDAILRHQLFSWKGSLTSGAAPKKDNASPTRQLLWLVSSGYRFDGWNVVAESDGPPK